MAEKKMGQTDEMRAKALQQDKLAAIGQLAAGIAHEINNPIGFIQSNLGTIECYRLDLTQLLDHYMRLETEIRDVLQKSQTDRIEFRLNAIQHIKDEIDLPFILSDYQKVVEDSIEGTRRIAKIVSNLKKFAHLDKARIEYDDINERIENTLSILAGRIRPEVRVVKQFARLEPVKCHPQHMGQVFLNILVNALQALRRAGVIHIRTRQVWDNVEIEIRDTGCGIPQEFITRIFDPFFTTRAVGQGVGLGLTVAHNVIRTHGGSINVESRVGKGTRFRIRLPVRGADETGETITEDRP